jgi:hypothetical protein
VGEGSGQLLAIDVNTGDIIWDNMLALPNFGGATVINDLVITATFDGMVYAFDTETGEEVWRWPAPGPVNAWPSAAGDTLLVPVGLANPFPVLIALKPGAAGPVLSMLPVDGQSVETGNVTVSAMAFNIDLADKIGEENVDGEGHLLYFLDEDAPLATANTTFTFSDVSVGEHTFSVELVNNDNTPLDPPVIVTATVDVTPPQPRITITAPENQSMDSPGDITITVEVSNFNLVDKLGEPNAAGEGHLHYFMDVVAPTIPGQPAFTGEGTFAATAGTSFTWHDVPAGTHTFSVELVNNDHTPLSPPVVAKVVVAVATPQTGGGP